MENYLDDHPGDRDLFSTLQKLASTAVIDISKYLSRETLELAGHIYTRRLYRSRDVRKTLEIMIRKEKNDIERSLYTMFCKKNVVFRDFSVKLAFVHEFSRFKKFFTDSDDAEYVMQKLVHQYRCLGEDVVEDAECRIFDLPPRRLYLYFSFFGSAFSTKNIMKVLDCSAVELKPFVASFLPQKEYYEQLSMLILSASPDDKVLLISSMGDIDKVQFYISLSEICMARARTDRGQFKEFVEIMKMVNVDRKTKIEILHGWLRAFVYMKRLNEFVKLFEQIGELGGSEYRMFRSFYDVIYKYKKSGRLDFTDFLTECEEAEEGNLFATYKWKEIHGVYKG